MPDFKVWTKESGIRYLKAKDYRDVACRVLREMHRQVGPLQIGADGLATRDTGAAAAASRDRRAALRECSGLG